MKEEFLKLPGALRRQIAFRLGTGMASLILFAALLICFGDWYFSFPCLALSVFLAVSGGWLFYNSVKGNYLHIEGICEAIETAGLRKRVKSIHIRMEGSTLKLPIRSRVAGLSVGDAVTVFLSEKTPVYECDGGYMICSYYALESERKRTTNGSKQRKTGLAAGGDHGTDPGK